MEDVFLVQDAEAGEDRLVRSDGTFTVFPLNSLLPWCKLNGIKLKKVEDDPLEFLIAPKDEVQAATVIEHGWPGAAA